MPYPVYEKGLFFTGKVDMCAVAKDEDKYNRFGAKISEGPVRVDYSTREGRTEAHMFIHKHLCLGHLVMSEPV